MTVKTDTTFIKITNKDIYQTIVDGQRATDEKFEKTNAKLNAIISRQDITNGKVKKSMWIASTALTIALLVLGYFVNHLVSIAK